MAIRYTLMDAKWELFIDGSLQGSFLLTGILDSNREMKLKNGYIRDGASIVAVPFTGNLTCVTVSTKVDEFDKMIGSEIKGGPGEDVVCPTDDGAMTVALACGQSTCSNISSAVLCQANSGLSVSNVWVDAGTKDYLECDTGAVTGICTSGKDTSETTVKCRYANDTEVIHRIRCNTAINVYNGGDCVYVLQSSFTD